MDTSASPLGPPRLDGGRLEALASITACIAHSEDLETALSKSLSATLEALNLEVGGLYLLDEESGELRATSHHRGIPPEYPQAVARFAKGEAIIGRALESVTPVVVRDLASAAEARDATRQIGVRSVVFVPLYARGRAVGMMPVGSYSIRDFAPEDIQLLAAVGGLLGSAIENARLVEEERRHLSQVQALWEIDRALVEDGDLTEVLSTIAREASRLGGGEAVIILVEGDEDLRVASSSGDTALELLGNPPALAGASIAPFLTSSTPTAVRVQGKDGPARALVIPMRVGGAGGSQAPLAGKERTLGGLVVVKPEGQWQPGDLTTLATFGSRAALALAKADARQAESRRTSQLALLAGASEIAASTLDVNVLPGLVARYIQRAFGYYSVAVYLVREDARQAVLAGSAGAAATLSPSGHRVPFGQGIIGWVVEHGEYILANDVRREPRFIRGNMTATLSELAVPVRLAGDVVAVINVESDRLDAFDEGDVVAVDGIAAQVASAVRNARLFEEKVRALRNLEILQEITNVLNSDLDLDALLDRIARRSVEAVRPAQMGAVLLFDDDMLKVRSSFGYPDPEPLRRVGILFHEGLPGSVFVSGQGRVVRSSPGDYGRQAPAFREAAGGGERRSALCVPIALPEEKLGVLLLESATSPDAFQPDDLRFAATLAHQAAIAIGNALRLRRILELDRQRQGYLSNVSHELRTPLTVIQGYVEAMQAEAQAGEKSEQYLRIAGEQCQRLGRMIDEVLEVSRFEQGVAQRHLDWGPVSLDSTVEDVLKILRQEATLKGITITARAEPGLPIVPGDERLLRLLVLSLLENAVKFSGKGGQVEIALWSTAEDVVISVCDDGIGIAPEQQDHIFDKFFMVDAGSAKAHGGAGIGLYLAREVVAIHGGTLEVRSELGRGSCFEARLPLRGESRR